MIVIGLTGNIGTGKSTVAAMLAELGAQVIDADKVGHDLLKRGGAAWADVVAAFGPSILDANEDIDRQKLASVVFRDEGALQGLNAIMHPRIYQATRQQIEKWRGEGVQVVVVEAPLLIEAGWSLTLVDRVWVTVASEGNIVKRLTQGRGLNKDAVLARLRHQSSPEEKRRGADSVINTDGSLEDVKAQVERLWRRLPEGCGGRS